jgi:hypothetical protein
MKKLLIALTLLFLAGYCIAQPQRQIGNTGYIVDVKGDTIRIPGALRVTAPAITTPNYVYSEDATTGRFSKTLASSFGGAQNVIQFVAANDYDSTYTNALFTTNVIVVRAGKEQALNDSTSGSGGFSLTGTTVKFYPKLLAGEVVRIYYGTVNTTIIGSEYTPTLRDLVLQTVTSGLAASGTSPRQYSGTICTSYDNYGVSDSSLPASTDGYIQWQVISGSSDNCIVGLNASHTNQRYRTGATNNFEVGAMILTNQLWVLDGTADMANTGITITGDIYLAIFRTGTTYKLRSSTDGSTWTDRYTFTGYTTASQLYGAISIPCFTNLSNLKVYNFR